MRRDPFQFAARSYSCPQSPTPRRRAWAIFPQSLFKCVWPAGISSQCRLESQGFSTMENGFSTSLAWCCIMKIMKEVRPRTLFLINAIRPFIQDRIGHSTNEVKGERDLCAKDKSKGRTMTKKKDIKRRKKIKMAYFIINYVFYVKPPSQKSFFCCIRLFIFKDRGINPLIPTAAFQHAWLQLEFRCSHLLG